MKVAVIGSGISGLTAAYLLDQKHDVHVIEKEARIGGHTATIDVEYEGENHAIDTGFIVYNNRTYANFIALLQALKVETQESSMGFSVSCESTGLEYAGNGLSALFAQKKNILSLSFWRMLYDIVKFNRQALSDLNLNRVSNEISLGEYLEKGGYSDGFCRHYLIPMGAAIWSASFAQMKAFPLKFFVQFFSNHGLLTIFDHPKWRVIKGGSRSYLAPLIEGFKNRIRCSQTISRVTRHEDRVEIFFDDGRVEVYDQVVFACHSDQALALLSDPSEDEQSILGNIRYQANSVILHTDISLLPENKQTWSSWNYKLETTESSLPVLTYNMNILQGLNSQHTYCVSLNADHLVDESKIIQTFTYAHPQFCIESSEAQAKKPLINGVNRTAFCGAYWGYGFHEDGVRSALDVAALMGVDASL